MYTNNAYLNNSKIDIKDKSKPLIVTSVGTYHLHTRPKLPTFRPRGRRDFQLLYIAAGKAHFYFDEKEEIVTAGHMVLYRPKELQKYEYHGEDQTEVYWVHFTDGDVTNILRSYGLTNENKVFFCGSGLEYSTIFRNMINELQITGYTPMQYILSKRIYNAEILLQDPSYNVTEIASIVGYDNPLYFSRIFKKAKGISPSEYRKNI